MDPAWLRPKEVDQTVQCHTHGPAFQTFICEHLFANPEQEWYSSAPSEDNRWPDAWCSICHEAYKTEGEWNERNENLLKIRLVCHRCYESRRALGTFVEV